MSARECWTSYAIRLCPREQSLMKGWDNSSLAYGRWEGFILRHSLTKELKLLLHLLGYLKLCTGLSFNCHIAISGLRCELGTTPSASSIAVTPSDQMSVLYVYSLCFMTSGLIQYGEPTCERWPALVWTDSAETPKSASLAIPSLLSRILAAFMSRCTWDSEESTFLWAWR